jgi:raffinose/stachyose/melibiose transport system permease protein
MGNRQRQALLFLIPAFLIFGTFVLIPATQTFLDSFHRVDPSGAREFVGLFHYDFALNDVRLRDSFLNNVTYFLYTVLFEVVVGLVLAFALEKPGRGVTLLRIAFFAPVALSMVVVGLVFGFLFKDGIGVFHEGGFLQPEKALLTISLVSGWAFCGLYMVIFLAGLSSIPTELEEAAALDGATGWQTIFHVKLPLLRGSLGVALLLCFTGAFRSFDFFWVMVPNQDHTSIVSTLLVREFLHFDNVGYGSALAVLLTVFVFASLGIAHGVRRLLIRNATPTTKAENA